MNIESTPIPTPGDMGGPLKAIYQGMEESLTNIFETVRTGQASLLMPAKTMNTVITAKIQEIGQAAASPPDGHRGGQAQNTDHNHKVAGDMTKRLDIIRTNLEKLITLAEDKTVKGVLFSDKAVQELGYLIGSAKYLFRCMNDAVTTKNPTLIKYVIDTAGALEDSADKFSQEHEERLVAGLCQPQSSAIFIDMLNNLKSSLWHLKALSRKAQYL
ncbi:MAG: hypothetical protein HY762_05265 [Planctomycetes bacterium]|nr:hypothetical protein [Planctomycetota bacterium]